VVAVARVYVAAHFPLDVIGGAALGMFLGGLINMAVPVPVGDAVDPGPAPAP
jgi:undecaprenyl-diphosphatase